MYIKGRKFHELGKMQIFTGVHSRWVMGVEALALFSKEGIKLVFLKKVFPSLAKHLKDVVIKGFLRALHAQPEDYSRLQL